MARALTAYLGCFHVEALNDVADRVLSGYPVHGIY